MCINGIDGTCIENSSSIYNVIPVTNGIVTAHSFKFAIGRANTSDSTRIADGCAIPVFQCVVGQRRINRYRCLLMSCRNGDSRFAHCRGGKKKRLPEPEKAGNNGYEEIFFLTYHSCINVSIRAGNNIR